MKRFRHIVIVLLSISCILMSAQNDKERIEKLRVDFINKHVDLSSAEAEKFWPVYNEYNDKIKAIRKNLRQSYRQKAGNITDKDAEDLYQLELQSRQAELDVHKLYSEKIKVIIGAKKMVRLRLAEEKFKQEMIGVIRGGD
jgi:hypothetical protein